LKAWLTASHARYICSRNWNRTGGGFNYLREMTNRGGRAREKAT